MKKKIIKKIKEITTLQLVVLLFLAIFILVLLQVFGSPNL